MAAWLAWEATLWWGLDFPIWAPISALVVSQETLSATMASVPGRCTGTLLGVVIALLANAVAGWLGVPLMVEVIAAIALCAAIAYGRPLLRVSIWTCLIVLVGADPRYTTFVMAADRAIEVILGAAIGAIVAMGFAWLRGFGRVNQAPAPTSVATDGD
jgi:uncharacterized membrane protein YgaE (UPF0421/DUF939 family)